MPIIHDYQYFRPTSLKEAVSILKKFKTPKILAGGTDLLGMLKEWDQGPDAVIDIKQIDGLNKITFSKGVLSIGCLVTFSDLLASDIICDNFPLLFEMAGVVASNGTRNRATLCGNICSSVPCMDSAGPLTVFEAKMIALGPKGKRAITCDKFFVAPRKTALKKDEILIAVEMKLPATNYGACYVKLGRYQGEDLSQANVSIVALPKNQYRVAFGSVAPTPIRAHKVEKIINGSDFTDEVIEKAQAMIEQEIKPITDLRASKEYRMHMCKIMFKRGLSAAIERLNGAGPDYGHRLI